jgi:hypothetical protein
MFTVLTVLILGVAACGLGQTILKENQTILKENQTVIYGLAGLSETKWLPTEEQTSQALNTITQFLNDPKEPQKFGRRHAKEAIRIREHYSEYNVQFAGVIKDGKKYILCNFLQADDSFTPHWKTQYVFVFDGGFWYWRILYDPETGELIDFQINGYA